MLLGGFFTPISNNLYANVNNESSANNTKAAKIDSNLPVKQTINENKKVVNENTTINETNNNKQAKLIIKYKDKKTGKELIPQVTLQGNRYEYYDLENIYKKEKLLDDNYILDISDLPKNTTGHYSSVKKKK